MAEGPLPAGSWLQPIAWDPSNITVQGSPLKATHPRKAATMPVCQVEGCGADLTDLRYFFRKQRICEQHARADVVTDAAGRQLRFCQQCTRLEPLLNFSTGRRSCKASLAKRQARAHRGKGDSSPDSSPERGAGPRRKAPHKGDHRSSSSEGGGSGGSGSGSGSGSGKLSSRRSGGLSHSSKRSRGESPSRGATPLGSGSPVHVMHATAAASSHAALPSNGSSMVASPQQLAAMQLAAAQHQQAALAAAAAQQQEQQQRAAQAAAAAQQQQQAAAAGDMLWSGSLVENDLEELLAMDPDALAEALLVSPTRMNHSGNASAASNGSSWLPAGTRGAAPQAPQQVPMPAQQWAGSAVVAPGPAVPMSPFQARRPGHPTPLEPKPPAILNGTAGPTAAHGASAGTSAAGAQLGGLSTGAAIGGSSAAAAWQAQPAAQQAAALQQQAGGVAAGVEHLHPVHVVSRFSLKIFGVSPDDLPPALRHELLAALQVSPTVLEGAIRCGCTHLIVDLLLTRQEQQALACAQRLSAAVQRIRSPANWRGLPALPAMVAQMGPIVALGTAAAVQDGVPPMPCLHMGSTALLPRLALDCPVATTVSAAAGRFRLQATPAPTGARHPASALAANLRCRSHGRLVGLAVAVQGPAGACFSEDEDARSDGASANLDAPAARKGEAAQPAAAVALEAWAPEAARPECWGLYEFEVTSGSLLSEAVPALVLPDEQAAAAAELCQLQQEERAGRVPPGTTAALLRLVAAVLRYLQLRRAAGEAGEGSAQATALAAAYPLPALQRLASVAQRLAALAVHARWPATIALLLPAVTADGSPADASAWELDTLAQPAPSLLHLAVASGAAASVASLRTWAQAHGFDWVPAAVPAEHAAEHAAHAVPAEPLADPLLLLAAAAGASLSGAMVAELTELLGQARLQQAADAAGADGWSPRRVAATTGAAELLAVLPAQAQPAEASPEGTTTAGHSWSGSETSAELEAELQPSPEKLRALQEDAWAQPLDAAGCSYGPGAQALLPKGAEAGGKAAGSARRRRSSAASHDANLLAGLLAEMQVPFADKQEQGGAGAARGWGARTGLSAHVIRSSLAGAAAAVVAALTAVAVRLSQEV